MPQYRLCRGYRIDILLASITQIAPGIYHSGNGDIMMADSLDEVRDFIIADIMRPPPCAAALYMATPLSNESHNRPRQPSLLEASAHDPPHL